MDVMEMNVSNVGTNNWGPDQLGDGLIHFGYYSDWNIDDGSGSCRFDFRFRLEDGSYRYKYNYDVCAAIDLNVVN
jgi:hypothetical protein